MNQIIPTTSFVQDQAHASKSAKFVPIQPSQIQTVLADHGFDLVSLRTGRARSEERADHQTTIARYRSRANLGVTSGGQPLFCDLVFKVPHLYGALTGYLGLFRQVCTNGMVAGLGTFSAGRIRHQGDALNQLDTMIRSLTAQNDTLIDNIIQMQARDVTPSELADLAKEVAHLRLPQNDAIRSVQYADLLKVRRAEDAKGDLFSVLNVIQENVMRYGLRYQTASSDENGILHVRNMVARPVGRNRSGDIESTNSVNLNASIWDAATKLLAA